MKKIMLKLSIIALIIQLFVITNVYADSNSFRIRFEEELAVKPGEEIEVPIILDNFQLEESIEKGIIAVSCKLKYNTDIFDLIGTQEEGSEDISYVNVINKSDIQDLTYTKDSGDLLVEIKKSGLRKYINNYTKIATIKLKAKETAKPGKYFLEISDVEGGNADYKIETEGYLSSIYVKGEETTEEEQKINSEELKIGTVNVIENEQLKVNYYRNDEGTELVIVPDSQNELDIGKVTVNGTEATEKEGKFYSNTEPGQVYQIVFYDENNKIITVNYIEIKIGEETQSDEETGSDNSIEVKQYSGGALDFGDEDTKNDEDNKDNKDDKEQEEKTDIENDNKKDENSKSEVEQKEIKGAQTGDYVVVACAVLLIAVVFNGVLIVKTCRKNKNNN